MEKVGIIAVVEDVGTFISDINKMNASVESFAKAGGDAGSAFDKGFGDVVTGALRHIGALAVDALGQAASATAGFLKDSIGLAGDFQSGMLEFQSVAGKEVDTKGLDQFKNLFLELGKELPVSTSDVQQAAIEMVKGGIDPAIVAAGALRQNIQFAAAAMDGDLANAAEISAKLLGGWADANASAAQKADFLTHSTDLLTKAANASSVDVKGLSQGIFNAQGIAKTAGVSFDDLTTTLALLAPRFSSSAEAGTSLKNMIARLQPTTDPAASAMEGLGLYSQEAGSAFYDAQGNFVGFEKAAQLLSSSLQGLTKEQQAATLQAIFGNDAMGAAAALADGGAAAYQNMTAALNNANGVADAAALKQQGFNTALDNAKGSVEALQITIGSALLPILTDLLNNVVAPAVNTLTDLSSAIGGDDDAFNKLSPTLQALVTVVDAVVQGFNENGLLGALDQLLPGFSGIVSPILAVVDAFSSSEDAANGLSGVLDALSGVWEHAIGVVEEVGKGYEDIINSVLPLVSKFVEAHGEEISGFFKTTFDMIISIINTALALYAAIVPPILHTIADFISAHGDTIIALFTGVWKVISGIIDGALTLIQGILKTALALIQGDWSGAWAAIQEMSARFVEDIIQVIEGAADAFGAAMQLDLDALMDIWNSVAGDWAGIGQSIIDGIIGGVVDGAKDLANAAADAAKSALDAAKSALGISSPSKEFAEVGADSMAGWQGGMQQDAPKMLNAVETFSDALLDRARSSLVGIQSSDVVRPVASGVQISAIGRAGGSSQTTVINVDARGSSLTVADITRGVQAGLMAEGRSADIRMRVPNV